MRIAWWRYRRIRALANGQSPSSVQSVPRVILVGNQLIRLADERLIKIVKDYQIARDPSFAVIWQPADLPLAQYPIQGPLTDLVELVSS